VLFGLRDIVEVESAFCDPSAASFLAVGDVHRLVF